MDILSPKIPDFARGIRFRLALVYSAIFGVCLILISVVITYEYLGISHEENDQALRSFAIDLSHYVRPDSLPKDFDNVIASEIAYFPFLIQNTMVSVRSLNGKLHFTNRKDLAAPHRPSFVDSNALHEFTNFRLPDGTKMRGINLRTSHLQRPLVVQVASAIDSLTAQQDRHILFLISIISLSILITAITSSLVARKALDPVRALIKQVEELLNQETYRPLPVPSTHDELSQLTMTYNSLLTQVKKTLTAQDQFVSHASHQLNTPLAIMRGELDVLLSKPRTSEEMNRFHTSLGQELARMAQLVRDMLLVSRVEAGRASFRFSPLRVDEVVTETVARLSVKAREKNIALKLDFESELLEDETALMVVGEKQLLTCLFENLIENCIKYSPQDSVVKIYLSKEDGHVCFRVQDQGPGISEEIHEKLKRSERFFRGEHTDKISGTGLGLYLVGKIAEYHSAQFKVENLVPPPGALFTVIFQKPIA
jgi:signal transduction histidine kinase